MIGDRLCAGLGSLRLVRRIVRHHHERMDGSGYPDRLRGDAIPLLARIVGVVDVFDALMAERPYKAALPFDRAAEMLREEAARGWRCADLVETFLNLIERDGLILTPARTTATGGGRGIRTPGTLSGSTVSQDRRLKPLGHPSASNDAKRPRPLARRGVERQIVAALRVE